MRRSVVLASVLVALAGGMVACSDKTNGTALPGDSTGGETTTDQTRTTRPTTSTGTGTSPTADIKPCSLLTADEQSQLGLDDEEERKLGSARTCRWRQRGPSATFPFDVLIYDNAGIKDLGSDVTVNPLPDVGSHKAVQVPAKQGGACTVVMGVTDTSRVATTAVADDVQKGCELALQMAKLVEPKLP